MSKSTGITIGGGVPVPALPSSQTTGQPPQLTFTPKVDKPDTIKRQATKQRRAILGPYLGPEPRVMVCIGEGEPVETLKGYPVQSSEGTLAFGYMFKSEGVRIPCCPDPVTIQWNINGYIVNSKGTQQLAPSVDAIVAELKKVHSKSKVN